MQTRIRLYLIIKISFTSGLLAALIKESLVMRIECTFGYFSKAPFTYVNRYQKALAKMLVKRQTPGFSVTIHVWNILLYCFIIQPQPNTIIIVDLWETSNKNEPCPPVTVLALARINRLQADKSSKEATILTMLIQQKQRLRGILTKSEFQSNGEAYLFISQGMKTNLNQIMQ